MSRFYKTTATPTVDYGFELPFDELFRAKEYKQNRHDAALEALQTGYDDVMDINYKPDDKDIVMGWRNSIKDIYDKYSNMPDLSNAAGLIQKDIRNTIPTNQIQDVKWNYDRYVAEQQHILDLKKNNMYRPDLNANIGTSGPTFTYGENGEIIPGTGREFLSTDPNPAQKVKSLNEMYFNNMPAHMKTEANINAKALHGSKDWQGLYSNLQSHFGVAGKKQIDELWGKAEAGDANAIKQLEGLTYDMLYHTGMEHLGPLVDKENKNNKSSSSDEVTSVPSSAYNKVITRASNNKGNNFSSSELQTLTGNESQLKNHIQVSGTGGGPLDSRLILSPSGVQNLPFFVQPPLYTPGNKGSWVQSNEASQFDIQQQAMQYMLLKKFFEGSNVSFDNIQGGMAGLGDLRYISDNVRNLEITDQLPPEIYMNNAIVYDILEEMPELLEHVTTDAYGDQRLDGEKMLKAGPIDFTEDQRNKLEALINQKLLQHQSLVSKYVTGDLSKQQTEELIALQHVGIHDPFSTEAMNIYKAHEKYNNDMDSDQQASVNAFTKIFGHKAFANANYDFKPLDGKNTWLEYIPGYNDDSGNELGDENQMLVYGQATFTESELENILQSIPKEDRNVETMNEDDHWYDWDWLPGGTNSWVEQWVKDGLILKTSESVKGTEEGKDVKVPVYRLPMTLRVPVGTEYRSRYDNENMNLGTNKGAEYGDYWDKQLTNQLQDVHLQNSAQREQTMRNNSDGYMIEAYVGSNAPATMTNVYSSPDMISARNVLYNNIVTDDATGINSQLSRIKGLDENLYNNLYDYIGDELDFLDKVNNASNQGKDAVNNLINTLYGDNSKRSMDKFQNDLRTNSRRVIKMGSILNPQMHNPLAEDYTDTELLAETRLLASNFNRLDNSLDASQSNTNIGITNGVVTDYNKLKTATDKTASLEGMKKFNPTNYTSINVRTGEGDNNVSGAWVNPRAEESLIQLNTWAKSTGNKLTITSMFRLPAYNNIVGGSGHSSHLDGNAIDLSLDSGRALWQAWQMGDPKVAGAITDMQIHGDHYHLVLRNSNKSGE